MMTPSDKQPLLKKKKWVTDNPLAREWVNTVFWTIFSGSRPEGIKIPSMVDLPEETYEVFHEALINGEFHGMASRTIGEQIKVILKPQFYKFLVEDRTRTDFFLQEVDWAFSAQLGRQIIVVGDVAMRKLYEGFGSGDTNPRFVKSLSYWTPTLNARDEITKLLMMAGYTKTNKNDDYHFSKVTLGIEHLVVLRGVLWESSKNWSMDLEREIWDRAMDVSRETEMPHLEITDLFVLVCRQFSTVSLMSSAIGLMDLVMVLERAGPSLDWDRIRHLKNRLVKPYWLWASLIALTQLEQKTGRKIEVPSWARTAIAEEDSFWHGFVESRLCWANPDLRLLDFPRAQSKVTRGV